jgi:hypothetical protein
MHNHFLPYYLHLTGTQKNTTYSKFPVSEEFLPTLNSENTD